MKKNLLLIALLAFIGMLGFLAFFWDGKAPTLLGGKAVLNEDIKNPMYGKFQLLSKPSLFNFLVQIYISY